MAKVQAVFTVPEPGGTRRPALRAVASTSAGALAVSHADGVTTRLRDAASGAAISVRLAGASAAKPETSDGYVVYRDALGAGSHVVHRPSESGTEDFALIPEGSSTTSLAYDVQLERGVVGVRQVGNVVELVDASGAPRIRATAPFVVDSAGTPREAKLAVTGCAVDSSAAEPWGRPVTPAGAESCRVSVSWDPAGLKAPLLVDPSWSSTGSMMYARTEASAAVLGNGQVLVVGGTSSTGLLAYQPVAELYNPALGTWAVTGSTRSAHISSVAAAFSTGDAVVFGGSLSLLGDLVCLLERSQECAHDAETYSVATGTWTADPSSSIVPLDTGMTATALATGKVLVIGGINIPTRCTLYAPTGAPTSCARPPQGFYGHTATLLADGRVLLAGGLGLRGPNRTAYLYDPTKNAWSATGATEASRLGGMSARLGDGRVLVTGGGVATAETYSPATGAWSSQPSMSTARLGATLTTLSTGKAVAAGGRSASGAYLATAEEFDPSTNTWSATSTMDSARSGHVAELLANGKVLVATGSSASSRFLGSTDLYTSTAAPPPPPPNCDDGNVCTADTASADGTCSHAPVANGTSCSDSSACTQVDSCQAGVCVGADPVTCSASDACHVAGSCNPSSGTCSNPAATDGTICTDGNACTTVDACAAGTCVGTTPVTCGAGDSCHLAGSCDPASGACSNPAAPNGTSCSDGNACTQADSCQAGTCTGSNPVECSASDSCHAAGTCNPTSGACSNPPAADGTSCSDGNACTAGDSCHAGSCGGGPAVSCTSQDSCHQAGTCDPASGACSNPAAPNGTSCSDGNACTVGDACQAGACSGGSTVSCPGGDSCHAAGSCDPASGACSAPTATNGPGCTDAGADAGSDAGVDAGTCASLDDHDPCTTDTCNVATNTPVHTPIAGCGGEVADVPNAFETRASILGRAVTPDGAPVTQITATVYDGSTTGPARSDVQISGTNGGFRIRLATFPQATPFSATNAQRELISIASANTIPILREVYVRPGDALDIGTVVLPVRDSQVTMIDATGGTATDSQGLIEVQIPPGAVSVPTPIVLTPHLTRESIPFPLPDGTLTTYAMTMEPVGQTFAAPVTVRLTNTRNLPPTMVIPAAYVDEVNGRWLDAGLAKWDGTKFAFTTRHFSAWDVNNGAEGHWLIRVSDGPTAADPQSSCSSPSTGAASGSAGQSITLPGVESAGSSSAVTLAYNSGLAGGIGDPGSSGSGGATGAAIKSKRASSLTANAANGSTTNTSGAVATSPSGGLTRSLQLSETCIPGAPTDVRSPSVTPGTCNPGDCKLGEPDRPLPSVTVHQMLLGSAASEDGPSDGGVLVENFTATVAVPEADSGTAAAPFSHESPSPWASRTTPAPRVALPHRWMTVAPTTPTPARPSSGARPGQP